MIVRFLLICEGSSDDALVHHIQRLLIQHGATEADGISSHFGTSLTEKVKQGLDLSAQPDLLFVQRDADHHLNTSAKGAEKRYAEIKGAVQLVNCVDQFSLWSYARPSGEPHWPLYPPPW